MAKHKKAASRGIAIIKKSNQLIEARYKFDIWETRFFLSILGQIRREDDDFAVYRVWYKDVVRAFGLKSNQSYELLRSAAKSLMGKSFFVNYEKDGHEREVQYHILRKIDYLKNDGEGGASESQEYIDVTVESEMKPLLLQLQRNFTAYDLRNVRKLGAYPVRFYELLKQYEAIGQRTLYVEELKKQLELTTEYARFPNFYQKIVQPAIREINAHTDLEVAEIDRVKEGKKVAALVFSIRKKPADRGAEAGPEAAKAPRSAAKAAPETIILDNSAAEKDRLFLLFQSKVVGELGVSPSVFLAELERAGEGQIEQAVRVTERAKRDGRLKNPSGFFVEALRKGFTDPKEEAAKRRAEAEARAALVAEIELRKDELALKINETIRELTVAQPSLPTAAVDALRQNPLARAFIEQQEAMAKRPFELEDFRRDATLREWVKTQITLLRPEAFAAFLPGAMREIEEMERRARA